MEYVGLIKNKMKGSMFIIMKENATRSTEWLFKVSLNICGQQWRRHLSVRSVQQDLLTIMTITFNALHGLQEIELFSHVVL